MTWRPKVAVLLATFHPNHFTLLQIDSLRKQLDVDITIFWGDDGSTEEEKLAIHETLRDFDYKFFSFENIGATQNFIELLKKAAGYNFYAFCDQDDLWLPEKLITSITKLHDSNRAALCHSRVTVFEGGQFEIGKEVCQDHTMKTLVAENCFMGCTLVFNAELRDILLSYPTEGIVWHDWWLGWLASSVGDVFTLVHPLTIYRIHHGNSIGLPDLREKFKRFLRRDGGITLGQTKLFRDRYSSIITEPSLSELNLWINIYQKSRLLRIFSLVRDSKRRSTLGDDYLRRISSIFKTP
jgi:glycosyltransferase involved in cell wall biosynthesis